MGPSGLSRRILSPSSAFHGGGDSPHRKCRKPAALCCCHATADFFAAFRRAVPSPCPSTDSLVVAGDLCSPPCVRCLSITFVAPRAPTHACVAPTSPQGAGPGGLIDCIKSVLPRRCLSVMRSYKAWKVSASVKACTRPTAVHCCRRSTCGARQKYRLNLFDEWPKQRGQPWRLHRAVFNYASYALIGWWRMQPVERHRPRLVGLWPPRRGSLRRPPSGCLPGACRA